MQARAHGGGAGAQQRAFVGGPTNLQNREEEQKDYVTHEELEMFREQLRSSRRQQQNMNDAEMAKLRVQLDQQRAQNLEMRATIGQMQGFLKRECV
eukprot:701494-Heterocapsa_arctica.AAC.1